MSRYVVEDVGINGVARVAYGHDHALGAFVQEFDAAGELLSDVDALFDGRPQVLEAIRPYELLVPATHMWRMRMGEAF